MLQKDNEGGRDMSKAMKRNARNGYLLTFPLVLGCAVFYALPIGTLLWKSFTNGVGNSFEFVGFRTYARLFQNEVFLLALKNTIKFSKLNVNKS